MRIGILSDIHEHVEELRLAIATLQDRGIDRFVVLGDVCANGKRLAETTAELVRVNAEGVWGNHDFGLCGEVDETTRSRYSTEVLSFFASLPPAVEIDGCWFQHIEPWLNSERVEDLWGCNSDEARDAERSFAAVPHRRIFLGHFHRWNVQTPQHSLEWHGEAPLPFERDQRYLVVVNAVFNGWCALLDTGADVLEPVKFC